MSVSPSKRGRPRGSRVDDAILDAAAKVFTERGYEETSMAEIARRAGVSTSAIHRRWEEKWVLALAVVTTATPPSAYDSGDLLSDGVNGLYERACVLANPTYRHLLLVLASLAVVNPYVGQVVRLAFESMTGASKDRLEMAIGRRELPPDTDVQLLRDLATGGILVPLLFTGRPRTREEITRIMKVLLAGISAVRAPED